MPRRPCLAVAPEGSLAGETGAPGPADAAESDALMPQNLDRTETALRAECLAAGVQYIQPGGVGYEKETLPRASHATRAVSRDKRRKCLREAIKRRQVDAQPKQASSCKWRGRLVLLWASWFTCLRGACSMDTLGTVGFTQHRARPVPALRPPCARPAAARARNTHARHTRARHARARQFRRPARTQPCSAQGCVCDCLIVKKWYW